MPKEDEHTIQFRRKQFKLAFSLTIHKTQGQTINTLFNFASKWRGSGALLVLDIILNMAKLALILVSSFTGHP